MPLSETTYEQRAQSRVAEGEREEHPNRERELEHRLDLVEPGEPQGDDVVIERGAGLSIVPVSSSPGERHKHRYEVEEKDHHKAQRSSPNRGKESDPELHIPQVKKYVRAHQPKSSSKPKAARTRSGGVSFQNQVVDEEREQEAKQVNPVPAAQKPAPKTGKPTALYFLERQSM